jgi:hypothetical protein
VRRVSRTLPWCPQHDVGPVKSAPNKSPTAQTEAIATQIWSTCSTTLTGPGAGPRGHCWLAACPGDRILRSRIHIRSRISGSNHFAFLSLAVRIGSGFKPSPLPWRVATWRADGAGKSRACFAPPGFCCLPVICSGAPKFSLCGARGIC